MRGLIVKILGTSLSFYLTDQLVDGFIIERTWQAFVIASIVFILVNAIVKPIIRLLFLPINLLTLGLFHWLINVIVLYLFDLIYSGINITGYDFAGYSSGILNLPPGHLSLFWVLVISSLAISLFYSIYEMLFTPR